MELSKRIKELLEEYDFSLCGEITERYDEKMCIRDRYRTLQVFFTNRKLKEDFKNGKRKYLFNHV